MFIQHARRFLNRQHRYIVPLVCLLSLMFITGCESQPEPNTEQAAATPPKATPTAPTSETAPGITFPEGPVKLLQEPIRLQRFESSAQALSSWRQYQKEKPALLLLTPSPLLIRTPNDQQEKIDVLAGDGNPAALAEASTRNRPHPLFSAGMTVDIALRRAWIDSATWILPNREPEFVPDQEMLRSGLIERGMLNEDEGNSLQLSGARVEGTVRGRPFTAAAVKDLPPPGRPVIVHFDLGYFQQLYKNEIATPMLQTIYQPLAELRQRNIEVVAATFSYSHLDSQIALDVRFVGEILERLLAEPALLDQPAPKNWQRQADAIYLTNFFQGEKVDELHRAQEKEAPDSAWVKFSLYRSAATLKQGEQALTYLAEAVKLDPMYAYEYGNLAQLAYEKRRPDESLRMLTLASKTFPDDPFIKLRIAELSAELGDHRTARHLAEQLKSLNWSPTYHPQIPAHLEKFIQSLSESN